MIIKATFETITPVFCAGANQNGPSEIRTFAIKGMVRWFYRALDGKCDRECEAEVFGAASGDKGTSSPLVLQMEDRLVGNNSYDAELKPTNAPSSGERYLGYTFYLGKRDQNWRKAIEPGRRFSILLVSRWRDPGENVLKAWLAGLWLLGHLGGIGSRMRRGFGTIALTSLEGDWPAKIDLPLPNCSQSLDEWCEKFTKGYNTLRNWFPKARRAQSPQPSLPKNLSPLFGKGCNDWIEALRDIGNLMRDYRARGNKYPRNAAFGLPLRSRKNDEIVPASSDLNRSPSRLWIRVVKVGGKYHPMVWLQESALLPRDGIKWKKGQGLVTPAGMKDLEDFITHLRTNGYK